MNTPTTILLARHGQTMWNLERRRQGQLNSPLTEKGLDDARKVAAQASSWPVDIIVASPLGRAFQTATIIGTALRVDVQPLDDLMEVHHGEYAGFTDAELDDAHPGWRDERLRDIYDWRFPGGESYHDAHDRAVRALASPQITGASCPLIVTHQMLACMLIGVLDHLDVGQALQRKLPHGQLLVFQQQ